MKKLSFVIEMWKMKKRGRYFYLYGFIDLCPVRNNGREIVVCDNETMHSWKCDKEMFDVRTKNHF